MLRTRVLSSLVILPPVLAAIWWDGWAFVVLLVLCGGAMAWELHSLAGARAGAGAWTIAAIGGATPLLLAFAGYQWTPMWLALAVVAAGLVLRRAAKNVSDTAVLTTVYLLILLTLASAGWLRNTLANGRETVLWLVAVIAATDVGAYFAGRSIGGPRLAPRISPNKTWAGLFGGIVLAGLTGYLAARLAGRAEEWDIVVASIVVAPVAQCGDLCESWLKRRAGVKDSGALIPGHGGMLDRVDGYLTAAPLVALIALLNRGVF